MNDFMDKKFSKKKSMKNDKNETAKHGWRVRKKKW